MRRIIRHFPDALPAFLPDGWKSHQHCGKSWVVRFHHHDAMSGYTALAMASRLTLTEDVCGFKTDGNEPRTIEMAVRHRQVFERANESRLIKQVLCSADWFAIY
jgi:hypothetical protein